MSDLQHDLFGRRSAGTPARTAVREERFDGQTYDHQLDRKRLTSQLDAVLYLLGDGRWWSVPELTKSVARIVGKSVSDSSTTARLRDLRKPKFGAHQIQSRRRAGGGSFEYRLSGGQS
jgi:hypothetical protein